MRIRIFTNNVAGGWHADDIDRFLGGSEEAVVLLSEAFARAGYIPYIYQTFKPDCKGSYERRGVKYLRREDVECKKEDILITFKDPLPWIAKEADPLIKIHWSSEIERPWNTSAIDAFICLSQFHADRSFFVEPEKKKVIQLGVDMKSLLNNREGKIPESMLYCSSPDRGLLDLLNDWPAIISNFPEVTLNVAYGFRNLELMSQGAIEFKNFLLSKMKQPGIKYLGELSRNDLEKEYWKADYWSLPLNNPESELFCLNAVKARAAQCIPVVNKIGALKTTVGSYIPYKNFLLGSKALESFTADVMPLSWDEVVRKFWMSLFEKILCEV